MKKNKKIKIKDKNKSKDKSVVLENEKPSPESNSGQKNQSDDSETEEVAGNNEETKSITTDLESENSKLKSDIQKEVDRRLRLSAEYDNFRKRTQSEYQRIYETAGERVITKLLPIIDDFQRFLDQEIATVEPIALKQGIELIFKKLMENISSENVKRIESLGKIFDADIHEAIAQLEDEAKPTGMILAEVERGYLMGARVIRHPKVVVNSYSEEEVKSNNE